MSGKYPHPLPKNSIDYYWQARGDTKEYFFFYDSSKQPQGHSSETWISVWCYKWGQHAWAILSKPPNTPSPCSAPMVKSTFSQHVSNLLCVSKVYMYVRMCVCACVWLLNSGAPQYAWATQSCCFQAWLRHECNTCVCSWGVWWFLFLEDYLVIAIRRTVKIRHFIGSTCLRICVMHTHNNRLPDLR